MSSSYFLQQNPFLVPTTDGKIIEEHVGRIISNESRLSIAHMIAPSGWSEPFQNPESCVKDQQTHPSIQSPALEIVLDDDYQSVIYMGCKSSWDPRYSWDFKIFPGIENGKIR